MKSICLLEKNEKEWETENREAQETSPPFFFFLFKRVLKGRSWLFSLSVLGYITLIYEDVLF